MNIDIPGTLAHFARQLQFSHCRKADVAQIKNIFGNMRAIQLPGEISFAIDVILAMDREANIAQETTSVLPNMPSIFTSKTRILVVYRNSICFRTEPDAFAVFRE